MTDKVEDIALILGSLDGGGIQKAAIRLMQEFLSKNIKTTLIAVNSDGVMKKDIPIGCTFVDLGQGRVRFSLVKLVRYLKHNKPEVVISSQTHLNVLMILARIFAGYPKKLIVREHIVFNQEIFRDRRITEKIRPVLIRLFYPFADKVVVVSADSANSIYRYSRLNYEIAVIQNGLDTDLVHKDASQPIVHRWLEDKNLKVVIGIGRLVTQKSFADLLKAFSLLEGIYNYRLIVLGTGPELEKLRSLSVKLHIQEIVDFPGFVENPFPFLARADVFVLSSKWEGFANVVIEALACGVPVVATNCPGGPSDLLINQSFGRIVSVGDVAAISSAIVELTEIDHDKRAIMQYAENFSVKKTAQQYIDLVNSLR